MKLSIYSMVFVFGWQQIIQSVYILCIQLIKWPSIHFAGFRKSLRNLPLKHIASPLMIAKENWLNMLTLSWMLLSTAKENVSSYKTSKSCLEIFLQHSDRAIVDFLKLIA